MTTGIRWGMRAIWALAACVWLAVLPAMARDVAAIAREGVPDAGYMMGTWKTHLIALASPLAANEKGGPASPDRLVQSCEVQWSQAADRFPADILPLRLSRSSS